MNLFDRTFDRITAWFVARPLFYRAFDTISTLSIKHPGYPATLIRFGVYGTLAILIIELAILKYKFQ